MRDQWPLVILGDHVDLVKGTSYRGEDLLPGSAMLVNLACIRPGGGFLSSGLKPFSGSYRPEHALHPGDLVLALTDVTQKGSVVGRPARLPKGSTESTFVASLDLARVAAKSPLIHLEYVYYRLRARDYVGRVHGAATGTTVRHLSPRDVLSFQFRLPPLSEQRAIAEVLGALDDKIEANARVVDAIDGLVRVEVAAALTDTQREASLGDLLQRVSEIAKPHELDQMSLYVGLEHMPRGSLFLKSWGSGEALASAKARFRPGDILFGRLRPYFKKVAVAPSLGVCSTDVLVLRPKVEEQAAFATVVCASDEVVDYASRGSEGTRMPRVSWDYLSRFRVPLPADADLVGLDRRIAPLLHLGIHLPLESIALARLRDTLLPKLVSGELGVRDAESLVKAVV